MKGTHRNYGTLFEDQIFIMIGIQGKKSQINGIDQIFHRITKGFPKLRKDTPMQIQEAHRTPNKQDQNRNSSGHMIVKKPNIQNKERVLKATREKSQITRKGKPMRATVDFSMETLKVRCSSLGSLEQN